jgi:nicotinate-nucleotide adenylyltransferase
MWSDSRARRVPVAGRPGALRLGFDLKPGMRVGLFGGSFDPAHAGHAHVAETALVRLGLDRVVWLVTPGNPLKSDQGRASLPARMQSAERQARGPSMIVSDAEARMGSRYTLDTLRVLRARFPGVRFVWVMGADNLLSFHAWRGWADILETVPVAVIARPGVLLKSRFAPTAIRFTHARLPSRAAKALAGSDPPAWVYLNARLNFASSTALRARLQKVSWETIAEEPETGASPLMLRMRYKRKP